jgi:hypothetical protein
MHNSERNLNRLGNEAEKLSLEEVKLQMVDDTISNTDSVGLVQLQRYKKNI